jgi:hypothetical protein
VHFSAALDNTDDTSANGRRPVNVTVSEGSFAMRASQFKVLILFLVLALAAMTLAGWTWDDGATISASVPQQSL